MANDIYNIETDLEVSIYTYASDVMLWSVSRYDQANWASGSEVQAWQNVSASVASVITNNAVTIEQGFKRSQTPQATIVLQNPDYDPFNNVTIRTGTPIRVRARITPDTSPSWVTIFEGKIDTASASYSHEWLNTVTLSCVTDMRDVLSYTAPNGLTTIDPAYATNYIDAINTAGGFNIGTSAVPDYLGYLLTGASGTAPVNVGELINQIADTNLGALIFKPGEIQPIRYVNLAELGDPDTAPVKVDFEAEVTANPSRADFSDITIGFNTEEILNTVTFQTVAGYGPVTLTNTQSRDLMGELSKNVTTLHADSADATAWANLFASVLPERRVKDVSAPVIKRTGGLNTNLVTAQLFDVASVYVNNAQVTIDEKYFITGINHVINRFTWNTIFTLWRGR